LKLSKNLIKLLLRDPVFIILSLNFFWVIISYALGTLFGKSSNPLFIMRQFKTLFLFLSFIYVLYRNGLSIKFLINRFSIFLVIIIVFLLSFFSPDIKESLYKTITFIYPLLYIVFSVNYLSKFGAINILIALSMVILVVYAIVPLSYFINGGSLDTNIIYGKNESNLFVSNHYGWSCALYIITSFTVLKFYPLKKLYKWCIIGFLPFVLILLILSASRSGILSVMIAFTFFILKKNSFNTFKKVLLIIFSFSILLILVNKNSFVVDYLAEKNSRQFESGDESRLITANSMFKTFGENPIYFITGVGMFNYSEINFNSLNLPSYHNSYLEILFGTGIFVFFAFLKFMIIKPIKVFWKTISDYSFLIFPLMLIPFFESDLTAGQFLFFPWFTFMIILNLKELNFYSKK
jgi:hypothetical protein